MASTAPFLHTEASAWWVAFDLVDQLDTELKQCDAVLRTTLGAARRPFARKGVAGAGNAKELAKYVQTAGWEPTNSAVHVSDVAALVDRLGGEQLYGTGADRLMIALRDLIQYAADAIAARRLIGESTVEGHIRIRHLRDCPNGREILQVDDDGVGMSARTLSEDLLDFGKSFWASERASSEFPGIHAAKHSPIGRFRIGFFSISMVAEKAKVLARLIRPGSTRHAVPLVRQRSLSTSNFQRSETDRLRNGRVHPGLNSNSNPASPLSRAESGSLATYLANSPLTYRSTTTLPRWCPASTCRSPSSWMVSPSKYMTDSRLNQSADRDGYVLCRTCQRVSMRPRSSSSTLCLPGYAKSVFVKYAMVSRPLESTVLHRTISLPPSR